MDNTACFWKPFCSKRVNESQKLLKLAEKYFDFSFSSLWAKLSSKNLFLIRFQILGLLVNTLTANHEYFCSKKRIYSYKVKSNYLKSIRLFPWLYLNFHNLHEIFNVPKKKWASYIKYFRSYWVRKMCLFKWIRGLLSENPLAVYVLTSHKNSWNLQKITLSYFFFILSQIGFLGLLVNKLTASYEYSRSNRENLPLPIEIKLPKKL